MKHFTHLRLLGVLLLMLCGVTGAWAETKSGSQDLSSMPDGWNYSNTTTYFNEKGGMKKQDAYIESPVIEDLRTAGTTAITIGVTSLQNGGTGSVLTISLLSSSGTVIGSKTITPVNASSTSNATEQTITFDSDLEGAAKIKIQCTKFEKNILVRACSWSVVYTPDENPNTGEDEEPVSTTLNTKTFDFSDLSIIYTDFACTENALSGNLHEVSTFYYKENQDSPVSAFTMTPVGDSNKSYFIKNSEIASAFWGKKDGTLELPTFEGYKITNIKTIASSACSKNVKVKIIDDEGDDVCDEQVWGKDVECTYNIPSDKQLSALVLMITNAYNAQLNKIEFTLLPTHQSIALNLSPATFSSEYALDFTNIEDVKAYIATGVEGTSVKLTQVTGAVPGNTGLLLVGEEDATADIPVVASAPAPETNLLIATGSTGTTIAASTEGSYNFLYGTDGVHGYGFYKLIDNSFDAPANKAYLHLTTDPLAAVASAPRINLIFDDDDATGIQQTIVLPMNDTLYNLAGQKVAASYKGIVIKNGKKMLNK